MQKELVTEMLPAADTTIAELILIEFGADPGYFNRVFSQQAGG